MAEAQASTKRASSGKSVKTVRSAGSDETDPELAALASVPDAPKMADFQHIRVQRDRSQSLTPLTPIEMSRVSASQVQLDNKEQGIGIDLTVDEDDEKEKSDATSDVESEEETEVLAKIKKRLAAGEESIKTTEAPALFERPEQKPSYEKIAQLKAIVEEQPMEPYVAEFDSTVKDEVLLIGDVNLEDIQAEERRLREEHVAYQEQEARLAREREQQLKLVEEAAKHRTSDMMEEQQRELKKKQLLLYQQEKLRSDNIRMAFRRSEDHLVRSLQVRKAEIETIYGDLKTSEGVYGGVEGRRWRIDWMGTPQPIKIKIHAVRGLKDKAPAGRYILMVSLYDRLGGEAMEWSKLRGQHWGAATLPVEHTGQFASTEMKIDQSVFTACPSKYKVRPSNIIMFELFLLRGALVPRDRVVGWGCFPVCDQNFDIVEGKFKLPMLRGEIDPFIDRHSRIDELINGDVDNWLCNLYFEIIKMPRYIHGQKEYEVELQYSSGLLSFPDRVIGAEYSVDGEDAKTFGDAFEEDEFQSVRMGDDREISDLDLKPSGDVEKKDFKKALLPGSDASKKPRGDTEDKVALLVQDSMPSFPVERDVHVRTGVDDDDDGLKTADGLTQGEWTKLQPVIGEPGVGYRVQLANPRFEYEQKMLKLYPKTLELAAANRTKETGLDASKRQEHRVSVRSEEGQKGRKVRVGKERFNYVRRQLASELGLRNWRSKEFWMMLFMCVIVFFMRIYLHYCSQWIMLMASSIPVDSFNFQPHTVDLNYQPTLLRTRYEMFIVLSGPLFLNVFFSLAMLASFALQKIFKFCPDLFSKFFLAFGVQCVLDPILIMIVDLGLQRHSEDWADKPIADCAKLYWHFYRAEGTGTAGIFITIFIYAFTMLLSSVLLYIYFLRLHNDGRLLDIYHRLHDVEEQFFLPHDSEMSLQEVTYILRKSERWRDDDGSRRKIAIYDYIMEEQEVDPLLTEEQLKEELEVDHDNEDDLVTGKRKEMSKRTREKKRDQKPPKREITTHIAIYKVGLDGLRELYRHFLRLPEGAIIEIFGPVNLPNMELKFRRWMNERTLPRAGAKGNDPAAFIELLFPVLRDPKTVMSSVAGGGSKRVYVPPIPKMLTLKNRTQQRPLSATSVSGVSFADSEDEPPGPYMRKASSASEHVEDEKQPAPGGQPKKSQ